jgi:hypothetical protein
VLCCGPRWLHSGGRTIQRAGFGWWVCRTIGYHQAGLLGSQGPSVGWAKLGSAGSVLDAGAGGLVCAGGSLASDVPLQRVGAAVAWTAPFYKRAGQMGSARVGAGPIAVRPAGSALDPCGVN